MRKAISRQVKLAVMVLLGYLLQCGVSGIVLTSTGAEYEGIRACSSAIKPHHYDLLDQRLAMFEELVANS